jgi:hypothetical protein
MVGIYFATQITFPVSYLIEIYILQVRMAFTRYHDDEARIKKNLEISTFSSRYAFDTPGPGINLPYMEDSQIRLQRWGANMWSDSTNLESEFRGLGRPLDHDVRTYKDASIHNGYQINFPSNDAHVEESRVSHPAWMFRDLEQTRWEVPIINRQAHAISPFDGPIQTRILEKDNYTCVLPSCDLVAKRTW